MISFVSVLASVLTYLCMFAFAAEGNVSILTEKVIKEVYGVEAHLYRDSEKPYMVPIRAV